MQLLINNSSPFSRVVRIVALEKGLSDKVTLVWSDPWSNEPALLASNPASRVPAIVTDEGISITESLLISQYMDSLSSDIPLFPIGNLKATHTVGLGMALMEAAFTTAITEKFEGKKASGSFFGLRRIEAINRTLVVLNKDAEGSSREPLTFGEIVVGVALAYMEFRLPNIDWKNRFGALYELYHRLAIRESFQQTEFK
jgi:glutathione S-transferase